MLTMRCALRSDVGRRGNNEDAAFGTGRLAAVADGVGGASAGEVASRMVIDAMAGLDKRRVSRNLDEELRDAIGQANRMLRFMVDAQPDLAGMGTTLTAVALSNAGEYLVANVGDSRTYLYRDGALRQLTHDQSFVQMLVDSGAISGEEARDHPQRSVVLDALNGQDREAPGIRRYPARAGDRLLLCSDGLSDALPDDAAAELLEASSRDLAAERLVAAALERGARDNVTVLVADVVVSDDPAEGWLAPLPPASHSSV
jgi:PPM family protein phosphatase